MGCVYLYFSCFASLGLGPSLNHMIAPASAWEITLENMDKSNRYQVTTKSVYTAWDDWMYASLLMDTIPQWLVLMAVKMALAVYLSET